MNIPDPKTEAFARFAGEVLQGEKTLHKQTAYNAPDDDFFTWQCVRCGLRSCYDISEDRCPETDPIDCKDWNVAMKWRDWAVEEFGVEKLEYHLIDVCMESKYEGSFLCWLITAKSTDIIETVVRLVLKEKE